MSAGILDEGQIIGDAVVESLISESGTRAVYRARQVALGRSVALHVSVAPPRSEERTRFLSIAHAMAAADHPNLLPIYESGETSGLAYAVTQRPSGDYLSDRSLESLDALEVGEQIAGALEALADAGVVLGDVPPKAVTLDSDGRHVSLLALEAPPTGRHDLGDAADALVALLGESIPNEVKSGRHDSPSAVMAAARASLGRPRPTRRRLLIFAVASVVLVVGGLLAFLLPHLGDRAAESPDPDQPAARLVASIPVGGVPTSVTVAGDSVYATIEGGNLVRIDPRTNHVIGSPTRYHPAKAKFVGLRGGGDSLYVIADNRLTRFDISAGALRSAASRRSPADTTFAAVLRFGDKVYASTYSQNDPSNGRILRLDPTSVRTASPPIHLDGSVQDLNAGGGMVWATSDAGTLTRIDPASHDTLVRRVGANANQGVVYDGRVWTTDPYQGTFVPTRMDTMEVEPRIARPPVSGTVGSAVLDGSLWVTGLTGADRKSPAQLFRIDPRTRRPLGRPLHLGPGARWLASGAGAIWVRSEDRHAVLKVVPTVPVPAAHAPTPEPNGPPRLLPGPVAPGRWVSRDLGFDITLRLAKPGWLAITLPVSLYIASIEHPASGFSIDTPQAVIGANGRPQLIKSVPQLLRVLRSRPELAVRRLAGLRIGGEPALNLRVGLRPGRSARGGCGPGCAAIVSFGPVSYQVFEGNPEQIMFFRHHGKLLMATVDAVPEDEEVAADALAVIRSLSFG